MLLLLAAAAGWWAGSPPADDAPSWAPSWVVRLWPVLAGAVLPVLGVLVVLGLGIVLWSRTAETWLREGPKLWSEASKALGPVVGPLVRG